MVNGKSPIVLGMDVGGSHVTAALVDIDQQKILPDSRCRLDLDSQRAAALILLDWLKVVDACYQHYPHLEKQIGMAMPGPCDYEHGISYIKGLNKYGNLFGLNLPERLSTLLGISPQQVTMTNDAACFLQGELAMGVAQDFERPIGVILGTGCGTAKVKDGLGCDGELWQLPFKNGIAEDYLSTNWFKIRYQELTGKQIMGAKDLAATYQADPISRAIFEEFAQNLADFLIIFSELENADSIVLGGNIMKAQAYFLNTVQEKLRACDVHIPILISKLGENAPIIGAAVAFDKKSVRQLNSK